MSIPPRRLPASGPRRHACFVVLAGFLLVAGILVPGVGRAQNVVESTTPGVADNVPSSPTGVSIAFTSSLAPNSTPTLAVLNRGGEVVPLGPAAPAPDAPQRLTAPVLTPLPPGSYTALWSAQLTGEDAPRAGSFGFRVGSALALPGASTELGTWPAGWAAIARTLIIIGAGGALAPVLSASSDAAAAPRALRRTGLVGGVVALLGALALTVLPGVLGTSGSGLADMSPAAMALLLAAAIMAGLSLLPATAAISPEPRSAGRVLLLLSAVAALLALGWWSVAVMLPAARPLPSAALLLLPLLVAGTIASALCLVTRSRSDPASGPAPRSRAIWTGVIGGVLAVVLTGLAAAGELPLFGRGSFGLAAVVLLVMLLAGTGLILAARQFAPGPRLALPVVVLAAVPLAILGLTAPAAQATDMASLVAVDLVAPTARAASGRALAHLVTQPAMPGENTFAAYVTAESGAPLRAAAPASLVLTTLSGPETTSTIPLTAIASSPFVAGTGPLAFSGWWQADLLGPDGDAVASFVLLAPDPNVAGTGPTPPTDAAAESRFQSALANLTALRHVRFLVNLGSGLGTHGETMIAINAGGDGAVPSYEERSGQYESIIIGDRQWFRLRDADWQERGAGPINTPANWGSTYEHATGFQLGPIVSSASEPLQVITFYVPRQFEPRQEPAWFAWWVGTETGYLHQEAMISTQHYMVYRYAGFDTPIAIAPPVASPVATPAADEPSN